MDQFKNDFLLNDAHVNPVFERKMKAVLKDIRGKQIGEFTGEWLVTEAYRSVERQRYLFSIGMSQKKLVALGFTVEEIQKYRKQGSKATGSRVTKTLSSKHIKGIACDIAPIRGDAIWWSAPNEVWAIIGKAAKAHGLEWGGSWSSIVDKPHVQMPEE